MAGVFAASLLALSATAGAQEWSERTVLKFSEPVMVPGATLQPGTYVFHLLDSPANRHMMEITREDTQQNVATVLTVPTKRQDPRGDVVVKFNPTTPGTPLALKGFFYPGSLYGHEFVYSDKEAKDIAARTRTLVLSTDVAGSDMEKGTLKTYDASGVASAWKGDEAAAASFESWDRQRHTTAAAVTETATGERARSTAPAIESSFKGQRVTVDQLEDDPQTYIGKTVSVDAEVEEVYGPRMFTIDEPHWGDLEGEILVFVPTAFAALVQDDDRVTVSGTVKQFASSEFSKEWGWMDLDQAAEGRMAKRPVLIADRVVGGDNRSALLIDIDQRSATSSSAANAPAANATGTNRSDQAAEPGATGTSGRSMAAVTDIADVAQADLDMVGRNVSLERVQINATGDQHGLFATSGGRTLYILPAAGERPGVSKGDTVSIDGVILQMPRFMKDRLQKSSNVQSFNDTVYVYATDVTR